MSDMVERVAVALLSALEAEAVYAKAVDGDLGKCLVDGGLFDMRAVARAAIVEMRQPTQEISQAVGRRAWFSGSGVDPATVWQAGIDAALKE